MKKYSKSNLHSRSYSSQLIIQIIFIQIIIINSTFLCKTDVKIKNNLKSTSESKVLSNFKKGKESGKSNNSSDSINSNKKEIKMLENTKYTKSKQPMLTSKFFYQLDSKKLDNHFMSNKNLMYNQISHLNHVNQENTVINNNRINKHYGNNNTGNDNMLENSNETNIREYNDDMNLSYKGQNSDSLNSLSKETHNRGENNNINNKLEQKKLFKTDKDSEIINDQLDNILNNICNSKLSIIKTLNNIDSDAKTVEIKLEKLKKLHRSQKVIDFTTIVNELNSLKSELIKVSYLSDTLKLANCDGMEDILVDINRSESNLSTYFETIQAYVQHNKDLSLLKLIVLS